MSEIKIDAIDLFQKTLSKDEREKAFWVYQNYETHLRNQELAKILKPNMQKINDYLAQENDPVYFAYLLEYVFDQTKKEI